MCGFLRFIHQVRKCRRRRSRRGECHVSASDFYSFSTRVQPRMQRSALEPFFVAGLEIEINNRRKPEGEISSRNLLSVCGPEFWMGIDCIVIQRPGAAHM